MSSFHYAAYSYLDEWFREDSFFHGRLGIQESAGVSRSEGAACLVKVATYYRVARTLKDIGEEPRFNAAYESLTLIENINRDNVVEKVCELASSFKERYGAYALSAASKFLWMRFRSPVVIYDSLAAKYLRKVGIQVGEANYPRYYYAWTEQFNKHEAGIRQACADLEQIKNFTLRPNNGLTTLTNSRWFRERVFDHFMLQSVEFDLKRARS